MFKSNVLQSLSNISSATIAFPKSDFRYIDEAICTLTFVVYVIPRYDRKASNSNADGLSL